MQGHDTIIVNQEPVVIAIMSRSRTILQATRLIIDYKPALATEISRDL